MSTIAETLSRLKKSEFRAKFHLSEKDRAYISEKGISVIRKHCEDFIRERLAPAVIPNDGKQTPMRGHPVFVAQHACACCCRKCLKKWYNVPWNQSYNDPTKKDCKSADGLDRKRNYHAKRINSFTV